LKDLLQKRLLTVSRTQECSRSNLWQWDSKQ